MVNEDGVMKLRRSWTVKTFTKGLEFIREVAFLAENEGTSCYLYIFIFVTDLISKGSCIHTNCDQYVNNAGHHPDLHLVDWNNVTVEIWTHVLGMNYLLFVITKSL